VADAPGALAALFRPSVQGYLISWFRYDPAREIAALAAPVLIVHGTTDLQVSVEDARWLAAANEGARLLVIPGMNHALKRAVTPEQQTAAYTDASIPIDAAVPDAIASFAGAANAPARSTP